MSDGPWRRPPLVRTTGELALFLAASTAVALVAGASFVVLRPMVLLRDALGRR